MTYHIKVLYLMITAIWAIRLHPYGFIVQSACSEVKESALFEFVQLFILWKSFIQLIRNLHDIRYRKNSNRSIGVGEGLLNPPLKNHTKKTLVLKLNLLSTFTQIRDKYVQLSISVTWYFIVYLQYWILDKTMIALQCIGLSQYRIKSRWR